MKIRGLERQCVSSPLVVVVVIGSGGRGGQV